MTEVRVKAEVARPAPDEVVSQGTSYRMHGAAWAGQSDVAKVEVSDDGGRTWAEAKLVGQPVPFAWRLWEHDWSVPSRPGRRIIMARATDDQGRMQPLKRDPDLRDADGQRLLR